MTMAATYRQAFVDKHRMNLRSNNFLGCALQRVDALLEAVEVEEVAFQAGCQAGELRAIITSALASPQRKLAAMHLRIKKHLGATAPKLAAQVPPPSQGRPPPPSSVWLNS